MTFKKKQQWLYVIIIIIFSVPLECVGKEKNTDQARPLNTYIE